MSRVPPPDLPSSDHGAHTLRVWRGVIVGVHGDDVFVELGPRMQGVISAREFAARPEVGQEHDFTLRGREEELWALALCPDGVLPDWADTEPGSQVQARIVRRNPGGFEAKVGQLHAFVPLSQCGVPREDDPNVLLGKTLTCEVIEVDPERQRVVVSRKLVLQRAKRSSHDAEVGTLEVGQVIQGRVTRIEEYGAFVRFGRGLQGLVHVSNLSHERVGHAADVLEKGQHVHARVLSIRAKGKRISLGLRQMTPSPWRDFVRVRGAGDLLMGTVARHLESGVIVRLGVGVEGFLHRSETGLGPERSFAGVLALGREIPVRIVEIDEEAERMSLSSLLASGAALRVDDLGTLADMETTDSSGGENDGNLSVGLGALLRNALQARVVPPAEAGSP